MHFIDLQRLFLNFLMMVDPQKVYSTSLASFTDNFVLSSASLFDVSDFFYVQKFNLTVLRNSVKVRRVCVFIRVSTSLKNSTRVELREYSPILIRVKLG